MRTRCPTCRREMQWSMDNVFRPFCSDRCRLIDLGAWLTEGRAIPGDAPQPEDGTSLPDAPQGGDDR